MDIVDCIKKRTSIRDYSNKTIDKKDIERLIIAASLAPTARNIQPWEFIIVTKKEDLKCLANITDHGKFIKDAACCIVVVCKDTKYYLEDGCAATENILLQASGLGLGACWVAGDKKAYANDILLFLKVPETFKLVSMVALGFPSRAVKSKEKRSFKQLLHWERFNR